MNYPRNLQSAKNWEYKFWNKQPMPKLEDKFFEDGPFYKDIVLPEQKLPNEFVWKNFDMNNDNDVQQVYDLLDKYYVEDANNEFRMHYSKELLKFYFSNNKYIALGVCVAKSNLLVGFIAGKVIKMQVNKNKLDVVMTNFLCIHHKLRYKRLVPLLVNELRRQFNDLNYQQAFFATSIYLPSPILKSVYYHRPIDVIKLVDTGFIKIVGNITLDDIIRVNYIPDELHNKNFKKITLDHLDQAYEIFNNYVERYNVHQIFTKDEFSKYFIENDFVHTYVIECDNIVYDFICYYVLQSKVLKENEDYQYLNIAYLSHYTSTCETSYRLIKDLLITAKKNNIDAVNALDIMDNEAILNDLGFNQGTGLMYYYLYNWKMSPIKNFQICMFPF